MGPSDAHTVWSHSSAREHLFQMNDHSCAQWHIQWMPTEALFAIGKHGKQPPYWPIRPYLNKSQQVHGPEHWMAIKHGHVELERWLTEYSTYLESMRTYPKPLESTEIWARWQVVCSCNVSVPWVRWRGLASKVCSSPPHMRHGAHMPPPIHNSNNNQR